MSLTADRTDESPSLLNTTEAAYYLALHPQTMTTWRAQGRGPRFLKVGRAVRYRALDIEKWLKANEQVSTRASL